MPVDDALQRSLGPAYIVERELHGGGMARVFLAEERRFGRKVVIKLLAAERTGDLSVERFEREIAVAATLQQANIVPVISVARAAQAKRLVARHDAALRKATPARKP